MKTSKKMIPKLILIYHLNVHTTRQYWKYQFPYHHWSQATVSVDSTWMGDLVICLSLDNCSYEFASNLETVTRWINIYVCDLWRLVQWKRTRGYHLKVLKGLKVSTCLYRRRWFHKWIPSWWLILHLLLFGSTHGLC